LDDTEAIKQLKARYFRTMDTKAWDEMRTVFTDGVVIDTTASGGPAITGADEFVAFLRDTLRDSVTTHHGHMPEINVTSPTTASGIWALHDVIKWPNGVLMEGSGHYHETYEKVDGVWLIASSTLTRLYMDVTTAQA
jgi:uncharacterized protein (TIGR02246 family)